MRTVIELGKEGNQKFPIKAPDVSRHHATITIENGVWTLEDLGSTNGTYVMDENGKFVRIKKTVIDEYTKIALGSTTAMGLTFLAHHVLEDDPANFCAEMEHIISLYEDLQSVRDKIEEKSQKRMLIRNIPPIISAVIGLIVFIIFPKMRIGTIVIMSLVTSVLYAVINFKQTKDKSLKTFLRVQQNLIRCPNPSCNRPLNETDIENQMCARCHAHT